MSNIDKNYTLKEMTDALGSTFDVLNEEGAIVDMGLVLINFNSDYFVLSHSNGNVSHYPVMNTKLVTPEPLQTKGSIATNKELIEGIEASLAVLKRRLTTVINEY